jgi:hypothetical protein
MAKKIKNKQKKRNEKIVSPKMHKKYRTRQHQHLAGIQNM